MSIGQQIKDERKRRYMTADAVGRLVGRDRQTVYHWEQDKSEPSGEAMLRLIQHGFVTVPDLASEDVA